MKKILLLLFVFIFGCDKIPDSVVDTQSDYYQALNLKAPDSYTYQPNLSFITSLKLDNTSGVESVWADVIAPDGAQSISHIDLQDNGNMANGDSLKNDHVYSAVLPFSKSFINGKYNILYYVRARGGDDQIASHSLSFNNRQKLSPPVISNLVMPDTVSVGQTFIFTVTAFDSAGLKNIKAVYFSVYDAGGVPIATNLAMPDNGDSEHYGDSVAGDGIYSYKNSFTEAAKGQLRKFVFNAVNYSDSLSNTITHNLYVK